MLSRMLNVNNDTIRQLYYSHKSFKQGRGEKVVDINFDNVIESQYNNSTIFKRDSNMNSIIKKKEQVGGMIHTDKIEKIEKENKILEAIIKNYRMKKYVRKLYIDGHLDKKSIDMYNKLIINNK